MKILLKETSAEIEEKKSRFIAFIRPVKDIDEAEAFIASVKKKYWDARHNCSAFVLGSDASVTRCSDDGEPAGTAGRPMLEVLLHSEIRNIAVVVTRYFGGTLLGTGGLIRAYQEAVKSAIDCASSNGLIVEEIDGFSLTFRFDYTLLGKIQHYLNSEKISVIDTEYSDSVAISIQFAKEELDNIKKTITELTCDKVTFSEPITCTFCKIP